MSSGNIFETIKDALPLADYLQSLTSERITEGKHIQCVSPSHQEKTGSLLVKKDSCHCFGCGFGGDVIAVHQQLKGFAQPIDAALDLVEAYSSRFSTHFLDAVRTPQLNQQARVIYKEATLFLEQLAVAAHGRLLTAREDSPLQNQARSALKGRGLAYQRILDSFGAGIIDQETLNSLKIKPSRAVYEFLNMDPDNNHFLNRLVFPIKNRRGQVVGFTGRRLDPLFAENTRAPKWKHSPSSTIFDRSKVLYGFHENLPYITKHRTLNIVEGPFDVQALVRVGVNNKEESLPFAATCAALGVAVDANLLNVARSVQVTEINLILDLDKAGRQGVWRTIENCLPSLKDDLDLNVVFFPGSKDAEEFVRGFGKDVNAACEAVSQVFNAKIHVLSYIEEVIKDTYDFVHGNPGIMARTEKTILDLMNRLPKEGAEGYRSGFQELLERCRLKRRLADPDLASSAPDDLSKVDRATLMALQEKGEQAAQLLRQNNLTRRMSK